MLYHLTLDTGHVARTQRSDVADDVIAVIKPILDQDQDSASPLIPPVWQTLRLLRGEGWAEWYITTVGTLHPVAMCVGCWSTPASQGIELAYAPRAGETQRPSLFGDIAAWQRVRALWPELPNEQPPVPWLLVGLMDGAADLTPEHAHMLGDLERCIFWTLAEVAPNWGLGLRRESVS